MSFDSVLRGGTLVRPGEAPAKADIGIAAGTIVAIAEPGTLPPGAIERDLDGLHVFPGVVDPHVHVGFGGGMEEYSADTRAASIGGVTSFFHIMIDSGSYLPLVEEHRREALVRSVLDFGFHATLMTDDHLAELGPLAELGVRSYKYFMSFRGSEGAYLGVEGTDDGVMFDVFTEVAARDGVLMVHPENIEVVWKLRDRLMAEGRDDLRAWHECRPPFVEAEAVGRASHFAAHTGARIYLVHISSAEALDAAVASRHRFPEASLYIETCPHFLTHTYDADVGSLAKVNPPLRGDADREALWTAVESDVVDVVASDHAGRRREAKQKSIWEASAGFPGLPLTLPTLISDGHHGRGLDLGRIAEVTAKRPAELFGLGHRKGDIAVGLDADFAVVDLEWAREVDAASLGTYSDYSLAEGETLTGWPRLTILRGDVVQVDGAVVDEPPAPRYLGDL